MRNRRARLTPALVLATALVAVPRTAAQAQSDNQKFRIIENRSTAPGGKIVGTGAFSGVGTTIPHRFVINPDFTFEGEETFVFDEGTLTVEFQGFISDFRLQAHRCVGHSQGTTTHLSVVSGSGVFEGATGTFTGGDRTIVWFERGPGGCSWEEVSRFSAFIGLTGVLELAEAA